MNAQPNVAPSLLGQQAFDGLGRQLTVVVGGRTTYYEYTTGQHPPSANVLADGKRVEFTYEPHLENQVLAIHPANEPANTFTYHPQLSLPVSASGPLGRQTMAYTACGLPKTDTWTVDGKAYVTTWRHALGGLLLGFDDADGVDHERRYDSFGRLDRVKADGITHDMTYDEFDRVASLTAVDAASGNRVVQTLSYDALGREHTRRFDITVVGSTRNIVQTLGYSALDQLTSRQWQDGTEVGKETFNYDNRGRLTRYTANPTAAPTDLFGNSVIDQQFTLNPFNGYETVVSTFADGKTDIATFNYATTDSTQVSSINHSHSSWPTTIELTYDKCGRAINYRFGATVNRPALDRTLTWDAQDRLIKVDDRTKICDYRYDPSGQLTDRVIDGMLTRSFFSGGQPTHETTGTDTLRLMGDGGTLFAQSKLAKGVHQATTLLGCDAQGSVRIEADSAVRTRFYTAHGAEAAKDDNSPFGFAGERRDTLTGWYIPSGYRPYDPLIMGFLSPDSDSPFGQGGLNPYAYCAGDPVNRIDPSGHGWVTWLAAGIGIGLALAATVATFGAAVPAFAALAGIGALTTSGAVAIGVSALSAVSLGTGIAATVLEATNKDSKAASILGWVSMGTGLAEFGMIMAPKAAARLSLKLGRSAGRASAKASGDAAVPTISRGNRQASRWVGGSEILRRAEDGTVDVAVHHKLWGEYLGFETHASPAGYLMSARGRFFNADGFFKRIISPRLQRMSRPKDEPIVLLACSAGKSGVAQRIADLSASPVMAWDGTIYIKGPKRLNQLLDIGPDSYKHSNWPSRVRLKDEPRYYKGPYSGTRVPAHFTIYWPAS